MSKTLKVWGGGWIDSQVRNRTRQTRALIAAYTKKQASEISGVSYGQLSTYWSETGNDRELATATEIGMWIYDVDDLHSEFHPETKIIKIK